MSPLVMFCRRCARAGRPGIRMSLSLVGVPHCGVCQRRDRGEIDALVEPGRDEADRVHNALAVKAEESAKWRTA